MNWNWPSIDDSSLGEKNLMQFLGSNKRQTTISILYLKLLIAYHYWCTREVIISFRCKNDWQLLHSDHVFSLWCLYVSHNIASNACYKLIAFAFSDLSSQIASVFLSVFEYSFLKLSQKWIPSSTFHPATVLLTVNSLGRKPQNLIWSITKRDAIFGRFF